MNSKDIRKRSQRQEQKVASDLGGRTVAGSGAAKFSGGGDVRKQGEIRVECKFTQKNYYDLSHSDLTKIKTQALKGGLEMPVMQIEFITAPTLKIAVMSDVNRCDQSNVLTVTGKQLRMKKDAVTKQLLNHPHYQLVFKGEDFYTVMRWEDFLDDLADKEEEEC